MEFVVKEQGLLQKQYKFCRQAFCFDDTSVMNINLMVFHRQGGRVLYANSSLTSKRFLIKCKTTI